MGIEGVGASGHDGASRLGWGGGPRFTRVPC